MQQRLITMLEMQDRMNRKVHPDWINQQFAWYRALWIECGELIEHYGYKWWKHQQPAWGHVKLEIVDIWHFGMSMRFDGASTPAQIAAGMLEELRLAPPQTMELREAVEALAGRGAGPPGSDRYLAFWHEHVLRRQQHAATDRRGNTPGTAGRASRTTRVA